MLKITPQKENYQSVRKSKFAHLHWKILDFGGEKSHFLPIPVELQQISLELKQESLS